MLLLGGNKMKNPLFATLKHKNQWMLFVKSRSDTDQEAHDIHKAFRRSRCDMWGDPVLKAYNYWKKFHEQR